MRSKIRNIKRKIGENIIIVGIIIMFITYSVKKENDINKFNI